MRRPRSPGAAPAPQNLSGAGPSGGGPSGSRPGAPGAWRELYGPPRLPSEVRGPRGRTGAAGPPAPPLFVRSLAAGRRGASRAECGGGGGGPSMVPVEARPGAARSSGEHGARMGSGPRAAGEEAELEAGAPSGGDPGTKAAAAGLSGPARPGGGVRLSVRRWSPRRRPRPWALGSAAAPGLLAAPRGESPWRLDPRGPGGAAGSFPGATAPAEWTWRPGTPRGLPRAGGCGRGAPRLDAVFLPAWRATPHPAPPDGGRGPAGGRLLRVARETPGADALPARGGAGLWVGARKPGPPRRACGEPLRVGNRATCSASRSPSPAQSWPSGQRPLRLRVSPPPPGAAARGRERTARAPSPGRRAGAPQDGRPLDGPRCGLREAPRVPCALGCARSRAAASVGGTACAPRAPAGRPIRAAPTCLFLSSRGGGLGRSARGPGVSPMRSESSWPPDTEPFPFLPQDLKEKKEVVEEAENGRDAPANGNAVSAPARPLQAGPGGGGCPCSRLTCLFSAEERGEWGAGGRQRGRRRRGRGRGGRGGGGGRRR